MKRKLLELIKMIEPYEDIDENTRIMKDGVLDSLDFAKFLVSLQEEFQVDIPEQMITEENFCTIETIAKLISELKA